MRFRIVHNQCLFMSEDLTLDNGKGTKRVTKAVSVQVQCEGFRCLAYRDDSGAWVDYHSGKLISGGVKVIDYPNAVEQPACL